MLPVSWPFFARFLALGFCRLLGPIIIFEINLFTRHKSLCIQMYIPFESPRFWLYSDCFVAVWKIVCWFFHFSLRFPAVFFYPLLAFGLFLPLYLWHYKFVFFLVAMLWLMSALCASVCVWFECLCHKRRRLLLFVCIDWVHWVVEVCCQQLPVAHLPPHPASPSPP